MLSCAECNLEEARAIDRTRRTIEKAQAQPKPCEQCGLRQATLVPMALADTPWIEIPVFYETVRRWSLKFGLGYAR